MRIKPGQRERSKQENYSGSESGAMDESYNVTPMYDN